MTNEGKKKKHPDFSVIVPVLHEEKMINELIEHLYGRDKRHPLGIEIIVVDGSPAQDTVSTIKHKDVVAICSQPGRSRQMNEGARQAKGDILLFLHADTRLPENAFSAIKTTLEQKKCAGGAFALVIDPNRLSLKSIAYFTTLRSRLTRVPYGDQAIFVRRDVFGMMGGFKDIILMEDLEFMRRLRKAGHRIHILPDKVMSSPRRWDREGVVRCTLRNWWIRACYLCGMSPVHLEKFYRQDHQGEGENHDREGKDKDKGK